MLVELEEAELVTEEGKHDADDHQWAPVSVLDIEEQAKAAESESFDDEV